MRKAVKGSHNMEFPEVRDSVQTLITVDIIMITPHDLSHPPWGSLRGATLYKCV
jgi:hypothetical protein